MTTATKTKRDFSFRKDTEDDEDDKDAKGYETGDTIKFLSWVTVQDTDLAFSPGTEVQIRAYHANPYGGAFTVRGDAVKPDGSSDKGDHVLSADCVYEKTEFVKHMQLTFAVGWVLRMTAKHPDLGAGCLVVVTNVDHSNVDAPYSVMRLGKTGDNDRDAISVGIDLQKFATATHVRVGNLIAFTKELDHVPAEMVAKVVSVESNKILMRNNAQSGFINTAHDPYDLFECTEAFCSDPMEALANIRRLTKVLELLHDPIPTPTSHG